MIHKNFKGGLKEVETPFTVYKDITWRRSRCAGCNELQNNYVEIVNPRTSILCFACFKVYWEGLDNFARNMEQHLVEDEI